MPSVDKPKAGTPLSATSAASWHATTLDLDGVNPWDVCHALHQKGLGVAGAADVAFAEPDFEQQWLWASDARRMMAVVDSCGAPQGQDSDVYAVGPKADWHIATQFSQLDDARKAAKRAKKSTRVRIAHLDTGFDPDHQTKPKHLNTVLDRNFVDEETPNSAVDRPSAIVNPMLGHGAATLALLAGDLTEAGGGRRLFGAAREHEVIPLRVANWVVLFKNSAIARALDYVHQLCADPDTRIHVLTMSMGGLASAAWADAVNALYDRGVFMVTAAGNNFGNLPTRFTVYPARFKRVVAACGAMADGRPYADLPLRKMAGCYGPESKQSTMLTAYTPNVPWAKFGCPDLVDHDGGGTSSATPQIAAAAALWIQKHKSAWEQAFDGEDSWMRVEAVRKALFDSAALPSEEMGRWFGQGVLRAKDALGVALAERSSLSRQPQDEVSFPILRTLIGLGVAAKPSAADRMLELEAIQLSQRSSDVDQALEGRDPADPSLSDAIPARRLLEALADDSAASDALKARVAKLLGADRTVVAPGAAPGLSTRLPPAVAAVPNHFRAPPPTERRLRVYAFDPMLGGRIETLHLNEAVVSVPWEDDLRPGPVGEYLEVVDIDPSSDAAYAPVDLNQPEVLAQHGLAPAEGLPQFHQQMVYAVAMKTIRHFERALGRVALWSERAASVEGEFDFRFVRRLRVYPHALREANAFYDPKKRALLFGYFNAVGSNAGEALPGGLIFTCLSHDIVAHETTHALLDGIHPHFREASNPDMLAFHEAFADIVALFQHFTLPEALRDRIAEARGDIRVADLLGGLAEQFGHAIGQRGALRSAIADFDETEGVWRRREPSQSDYATHTEPHDRGAVLVAAIFEAFAKIYERQTRDLVRLATGGSGVLPPGALSSDLVERLAQTASRIAGQVLQICIRALDYCPPVDLTFGDYLRALITADRDLVPDDDLAYRVAFASAFRERGIFPDGVRNLSQAALVWPGPEAMLGASLAQIFDGVELEWSLESDRLRAFLESNRTAKILYDKLYDATRQDEQLALATLGVVPTRKSDHKVTIDGVEGVVSPLRILSVRPLSRVGPGGRVLRNIVIEITQRWRPNGDPNFYRGGCAIIYDADARKISYIVRKKIGDRARIERERGFAANRPIGPYFAGGGAEEQPFAMLHRHTGLAAGDMSSPISSAGSASPPGRSRDAAAAEDEETPMLRIRMYRQGVGDCFLLTIPTGEDGPFRMLIDCGVHTSQTGGSDTLREIAKDLLVETDGRVDVLAITHEHEDHISGFRVAKETFADLKADALWLAWTENDKEPLAQELKGVRARALTALSRARARMAVLGLNREMDKLDSILGFFGGGDGVRAREAWETIRKTCDHKPEYWKPGAKPFELPNGTGRIYVLGPPQDKALIKKDSPSKTNSEVYEFGAYSGLLAALEPALADRVETPFEPASSIPLGAARAYRFFHARYWADRCAEPARDAREDMTQEWRRVEEDWLTATTTLALKLDADTNNTSLVLAIELGPPSDHAPVLLFPGDAQVGNWLSWQDVEWPDVHGRRVTGPDLLRRTVLYKVAHHVSHNATLKELGLEMMDDLKIALAPTNAEMAEKVHWGTLPWPALLERLREKTANRVIRSDETAPDAARSFIVKESELFYEIELPMPS